MNRLKANKFWVAGQKAVGYLLRTSERGADAWKMGLIHFAQRIYAKNPVLYEDIDWNIISVLWDHEPVLRLLNEVFFKFRGSLKAISFIHEQGFSLLRAARIDREGTAEFVEYVDAVGEELFCGLVRDIGAELCKSVFVNNPKGCSRLLLNYASCNETLASEWKDHFGALNGLLGEPQIKLLLGQLPRELAWAFKIEMLQIFREGECPDPLVAVAPLLDKYWRLLQALDIYHRYLETVGIEVEVFNGVEDFDRYLAKIVSCLLDIDLGRDQGVLLEYSPAPVSHYSLYGPLIQLLRTSSLVQILPEKSCTSFHLSLPFDEGGERAVGNISNRGDIDMLAVTIGLLYMADERASQGDRVSQVLRKRKQGTRRTAADIVKYGLAHKYPRQRFELRHGSFSKKTQVKKEIVREEEVIRVTQILYSCFSMFLNSVEHCQADPVRLRMRELWIDFYQGYQRIMSQIVFPRARTFQLWKMRRAKRDLWKMISIRRQHPNVVMELRGLVEKICLEVEMMLDELVERRIAVGDLSAIGELLENSCLKSV